MRKTLVSTCLVATVAAIVGLPLAQSTRAQGEKADLPHKVGLIDMAEVFKNYTKFKSLTDGLKEEVKGTTTRIQALQKEGQSYAEQMKEVNKDSPRYIELEKKILKVQAELGLLKNETQRDLARKEAQIYKDVYAEVEEAVTKYASYYKYTLVIRYSSEGLLDTDSPQTVIHKLNRLVVYRRTDDDITRSVVAYLNRKFSGGGAPAGN